MLEGRGTPALAVDSGISIYQAHRSPQWVSIEWVERPYILCSYLDAAQMYTSFFTWDLPLRWGLGSQGGWWSEWSVPKVGEVQVGAGS